MDDLEITGLHRIEVRDNSWDPSEAMLELKHRGIRVLQPIGRQNRYPALTLTAIDAEEYETPKNRRKIMWK